VRATHSIDTVPIEYQGRIARLEGNELELTIHRESDSVMEILDRLRAASISIEYVSVLSDSLEDVFVRMTAKQQEASS